MVEKTTNAMKCAKTALQWGQPWVQLLVRVALGVLFISSGVGKLQHFADFEQTALNYQVLPEVLTTMYAQMLPWVAILAGAYLMIGLFTQFAAVLVFLMMLSFIIAIVAVLIRGDEMDCGCFVGGRTEPVTPQKLVEDVFLLLLSVYLFFAPIGPWCIDRVLNRKDNEPNGSKIDY